MPLTPSGQKMMDAMVKEYGPEKGKRVFYATIRKKKMRGMEGGGGPKPGGLLTGGMGGGKWDN